MPYRAPAMDDYTSTYWLYKKETRDFSTWLAETALALGFPEHRFASRSHCDSNSHPRQHQRHQAERQQRDRTRHATASTSTAGSSSSQASMWPSSSSLPVTASPHKHKASSANNDSNHDANGGGGGGGGNCCGTGARDEGGYILKMHQFTELARFIAAQGHRIAGEWLQLLRRCIQRRVVCLDFFAQQSEPSLVGHAFFVDVLLQVADILEPCVAHHQQQQHEQQSSFQAESRASANHLDSGANTHVSATPRSSPGKTQGKDSKKTPAKGSGTKKKVSLTLREKVGDNLFAGLDVEEAPEADQTPPPTPDAATAPAPALKLLGALKFRRFDIEDSFEEAFCACSAFFADVREVRRIVRQLWSDYRCHQVDLVTASVVTNSAFQLLEEAHEDLLWDHAHFTLSSGGFFFSLVDRVFQMRTGEKLLEDRKVTRVDTGDGPAKGGGNGKANANAKAKAKAKSKAKAKAQAKDKGKAARPDKSEGGSDGQKLCRFESEASRQAMATLDDQFMLSSFDLLHSLFLTWDARRDTKGPLAAWRALPPEQQHRKRQGPPSNSPAAGEGQVQVEAAHPDDLLIQAFDDFAMLDEISITLSSAMDDRYVGGNRLDALYREFKDCIEDGEASLLLHVEMQIYLDVQAALGDQIGRGRIESKRYLRRMLRSFAEAGKFETLLSAEPSLQYKHGTYISSTRWEIEDILDELQRREELLLTSRWKTAADGDGDNEDRETHGSSNGVKPIVFAPNHQRIKWGSPLTPTRPRPPSRSLLERHPTFYGLQVFDALCAYNHFALHAANTSTAILTCAHLYVACRHHCADMVDIPEGIIRWPDMDLLIELQGAGKLFGGKVPATLAESCRAAWLVYGYPDDILHPLMQGSRVRRTEALKKLKGLHIYTRTDRLSNDSTVLDVFTVNSDRCCTRSTLSGNLSLGTNRIQRILDEVRAHEQRGSPGSSGGRASLASPGPPSLAIGNGNGSMTKGSVGNGSGGNGVVVVTANVGGTKAARKKATRAYFQQHRGKTAKDLSIVGVLKVLSAGLRLGMPVLQFDYLSLLTQCYAVLRPVHALFQKDPCVASLGAELPKGCRLMDMACNVLQTSLDRRRNVGIFRGRRVGPDIEVLKSSLVIELEKTMRAALAEAGDRSRECRRLRVSWISEGDDEREGEVEGIDDKTTASARSGGQGGGAKPSAAAAGPRAAVLTDDDAAFDSWLGLRYGVWSVTSKSKAG
ncbi:uncharacterized protein PFL1_06606 [Pseudozyma flocculosa PF-1]|uniref:DUF6604 domain-containing protein n=2 Tax=Pseudozyma flocculosa TaxID=84751 RepID=A0A5C3F9Z9_9BASI|nr:uncharacterized protein PFL1_06606 [Pseudozyma flocculosa PF-1]EPQ25932.1 hypothetical protein PFL1_06606 [Pseudozyma flocculosa PF-1]SPO40567.1 uncharacterized protein PSFLO_06049 [Pseudozyma flocculosa]